MPDGVDNATLDKLRNGGHDALDLRRGGNDAHADVVPLGHEPVFLVNEVRGAVYLLEGGEVVLRWDQEPRVVCATLGHLDEGAFGVPPEDSGTRRGRERSQQVQ